MTQPGHFWYKLNSKEEEINPIGLIKIPDFDQEQPSQEYYAFSVVIDEIVEFYVLSQETWSYPTLTDEEIIEQGGNPDRTIKGD